MVARRSSQGDHAAALLQSGVSQTQAARITGLHIRTVQRIYKSLSHLSRAKTLEKMRLLSTKEPRPIIAPTKECKASTPEEREEILTIARKVIEEHRDTLVALKNR